MHILWVGLGGCLGAIARYLVWRHFEVKRQSSAAVMGSGELQGLASVDFPYATLTVNVVGSFLIGALAVTAALKTDFPDDMRLFLVTGFLGAFTTFSAFSLETLRLLESGYPAKAGINIVLNVVLCLCFVWFGAMIARQLFGNSL